jgi:ABC-type branched-subunit amino acid transport system substrate-binding protein
LGRGITATTIKLGFNYVANSYSPKQSYPEEKASTEALIRAFNKQGGIAGRRIVPVWYRQDVAGSKTDAQRQQERCVVFTEDNQVFAVNPGFTTSENEAACMAKVGTLLVKTTGTDDTTWDDKNLGQYPNVWAPVTPSMTRLYPALVEHLYREKFFDRGAKIGLVYADKPQVRRAIKASLKPALANRKLAAAEEAAVQAAADANDLAATETQIQSAVLRFRSAGITHVIIASGYGSTIAGQWMHLAERQGYRPRYGLTSGATGASKEVFSGSDISAQFHGAIFFGWAPPTDLGDQYANTTPVVQCNALLRQAGIVDTRAKATCDYLNLLKAGLEHAPSLNVAGFRAGIRKVGTMPFAATFASNFSTGRRDGAAYARMARFDFTCHQKGATYCWKYYTPQFTF